MSANRGAQDIRRNTAPQGGGSEGRGGHPQQGDARSSSTPSTVTRGTRSDLIPVGSFVTMFTPCLIHLSLILSLSSSYSTSQQS